VLTVCATLILLVLGSLVTTLRAGMADKFWPTHPLHLVHADLAAEAERQGYAVHLYVLEHSHCAAGWLVGLMAILLCVWLWVSERRLWVRWLGTLALVGVSLQGVLGGLRVLFHANYGIDLATLHGCFAQLVFALLVALALFTSRWWNELSRLARSPRLRKLTLIVSLIVYLQLVFGAVVRHSHTRLAQRLHFLLAFVVLGVVFWLMTALREEGALERRVRLLGRVLMVVLTFQIMLGVEAWMMRFGNYVPPELLPFTMGSSIVRTLHFLCGTVLFATTVVLALLARQPLPRPATMTAPQREPALEGVA
jgi:cytochrome c oxidase assembly protein subunit 15